MDNEASKLYKALRGKGYSTDNIGDESTFLSKMTDANSRKQLYDWVKSRGDFRIGDYDSYERRLTGGTPSFENRKAVDNRENGREIQSLMASEPQAKEDGPAFLTLDQLAGKQPLPMESKPVTPQDEASALYRLSSTSLAQRLKPAVKDMEEESRLDNTVKQPAPSNKGDVTRYYMNRFKETEHGKRLEAELADRQREVQEKYADAFLKSPEYKALTGQYQGRQLDEKATGLYRKMYSEAIDEEMKPYREAFGRALSDRYGDSIRQGQQDFIKKEVGGKVEKLNEDIDTQLSDIKKRLRSYAGQGGNAMNALAGSTQYNQDKNTSKDRKIQKMLESAKSLNDESLRIINEAGKKGSSWVTALGRGVRDEVFNADTWTFGLSDLIKASSLKEVVEKADRGERLSKEEQALMDAAVTNLATEAYYASDLSRAYKAGQIAGASVPFTLEFAVNPVSASGSSIAKGILKYGMKRFGKAAVKNSLSKTGARLIGDAAAAAAMTGTSGIARVGAGTIERKTGDILYDIDDKGEIHYKGRERQQGTGEALARSFASTFLENQSEMIFNAFKGTGGVLLGQMEKWRPGITGKLKDFSVGDWYRQVFSNKTFRDIAERTQFHGLPEEYMEEVYNNFANVAIGEMDMKDATDLDTNIDTFLGLAPTTVAMSMIGLGGLGHQRIKSQLRGRKIEKEFMEQLSPDELKEIDALQDSKLISDYVKGVVRSADLSPEQKKLKIAAAYNRAERLAEQEGRSLQTPEQNAADDALADGAQQDHMGNYATELSREELGSRLDESLRNNIQDMVDAGASATEVENLLTGLDDTTAGTARDYYHVLLAEEGAIENAQETIEDSLRKFETSLMPMTDSNGNVTTATYKENPVFVRSVKGDNAIIQYEDGRTEMVLTKHLQDQTSTPAAQLVEKERERATAQAQEAMQNRFNLHPNTRIPHKGMQLWNGDTPYMISDIRKNTDGTQTVVAYPCGLNTETGQMEPKSGSTPIEMTYDEAMRLQNDYYNRMDAANAGQQEQPQVDNVSEKESKNEDDAPDRESNASNNEANKTSKEAGHALTHDEATELLSQMESRAEIAPSVELTIENWDSLFGKDGTVNTPIGTVKMGDNQFTKLMREGRNGKLGMVKPTLENPDLIIEDESKAKEGDKEERPSSLIFVKAFRKADGTRFYYFTSVTVSKEGKEVVVSNQEKRKNAIANLLSKDKLVWKHADDVSDASDVAQGLYSSQGEMSDLATEGTDAPQTKNIINPSESLPGNKNTASTEEKQEDGGNSSMLMKEDGTPDFINSGEEASLSFLTDKYKEKTAHKIGVTREAAETELKKAESALSKAQEAYDDTPIGKEGKAEAALNKARQTYDAARKEADFWNALDERMKKGQENTQTSSVMDVPAASEGKDMEASENREEATEKIAQAEADVDRNPTDAQKEAGNYRKGHLKLDGHDITIEQPKGSVRRGKDADGKEWESRMNNTYGYIRGTEGVDGDHIDVFLSDNPADGNVFVVDQADPKTGEFDEHKVMYGFGSAEEAKAAYLSNYEKGWKGLGNITEVSKEEFKKWIGSSHRKTKPFAEYSSVKKESGHIADGSKKVEEDPEFLAAVEHQGDVEQEWEDKIMDYIAEHYPTQATVSAETTSEKGLKEREAMKNDPVLKQMREQADAAYKEAEQATSETFKTTGNKAEARLGKVEEDEYASFAKQYDVNAEDVEMYAKGMRKGSSAQASRAIAKIGQTIMLRHESEIHSLRDLRKFRRPVEDALKEKYGDVDRLKEEYRLRVMDERNAMEAARKKAEAALRDAVIDRLRESGMEVITDVEEGQRVLDMANGVTESRKKKSASETGQGNPIDKETPKATAVSDADGTKILKDIDSLANKYDNITSQHATRSFISDVANALGINAKDKSSKYRTFETKNGNVVTVRLSNHNAKVSNFDSQGETDGISIVVSRDANKGIANDGDSHIVEFFYSDKALNKAEGKPLASIIRSIKQALYSGEFKDETGLAQREEVNVRFFRTPSGEAYGYTIGGRIYIDPRIANTETPIHEYTHLWATALRETNPKEWNNVVSLMKGTPLWEDVKKRYPELTDENDIADEVLAHFSGKRGAERLREAQRKALEENKGVMDAAVAVSAVNRVRRALRKFWKGVADFLHIHYASAEEVADRVMKDLLEGVNPRGLTENGKMRFSAKQKRALETASLRNNPRSLTVVSSADGAKVLNNIETLAKEFEKSATQPKTFIGDVAKALGMADRNKSSQYATFEAKNGKTVTIRLSNHNARTSNFDVNGEADGISIVVSPKRNAGVTNDGDAHITEFYYDAIKLRRAGGKPLAEIVRSIRQALYSGEFKDTTGLAEVQEVNAGNAIRFHFIGKKGAEAADRAEEASTRLDNLSVAREMEAAEKDAKAIKMATGWERGADGKWRYEIPDSRLNDMMDVDGKGTMVKRNEDDMLWTSGRLDDVVNAPELFKAYPQLKDVRLETDAITNDLPSNGEFDPNTNTITIHADELKYLNSILNHEIQHAIQHIEGFATGGTPEYLEHEFNAAKAEWRARAYAYELEEKAKELGDEYNQTAVEKALVKEYEDMDMSEWLPDKETRIKGFNYFARGYADRSMDEAIRRFRLDQSTRGDFNPFIEYTKLSGETEARNVQKRMGMTPEERKASLAAETEDVRREDQIFLHDGVESASIQEDNAKLEAENEKFNKELEDFKKGIHKGNLSLGRPQGKLSLVGLNASEMFITPKTLKEHMEKHGISVQDLKNLPSELANPMMVYEWGKKAKSMIAITNMTLSDGRKITAAIKLERNGEKVEVNELASIHGKAVERFMSDMTNAKDGGLEEALKYVDKEKALDWLGLVPPKGTASLTDQELAIANVIENFENPSGMAGKSTEVTGKAEESTAASPIEDEVSRLQETFHTRVRMVHNDAELTDSERRSVENRRRAAERRGVVPNIKGWFDPKTGDVVIYMPGVESAEDVRKTFLHEVVGHKGLRELFGAREYDGKMKELFGILPQKAQEEVKAAADGKYGGNISTAMDEYLAEQAEKDELPSWWRQAVAAVKDMLRKLGLDMKLTNNDVRYMLWRSRKRLRDTDLFDVAEDMANRNKWGIDGEEKRFRDISMVGEPSLYVTERNVGAARDMYERMVSETSYKLQESYQDSMLGLKKMMEAIEKGTNSRILDYENPYLAENALSSRNFAEMEAYRENVYKPVLQEVKNLTDEGMAYDDVVDYLYAKHGLERNAYMAQREAQEKFDKYRKDSPNGTKTLQDFIDECRQKDYSGLTALTEEKDNASAETKAKAMVDAVEKAHRTDALWTAINAATDATLSKQYETGLIDRKTYDSIKGMYKYYIPLRGWEEKTAAEVYDYLNSSQSNFSNPLIKAKGRRSKADDPIATIGNNAESGIIRGNRNLMKQKFLTMVQNHRTDLASVKDLWMRKKTSKDANGNTVEEWVAEFPDIPEDATPQQVEAIVEQFDRDMQAEKDAGEEVAKRKDKPDIPYRTDPKELREHQVVIYRAGVPYVVTVNGSPRAAQAVNGATNPNATENPLIQGLEKANRFMSANFTARNPGFIAANFVRDGIYANSIIRVKEDADYANDYHREWLAAARGMNGLLKRHESGTLDMSDPTDRMFSEFIKNGGETGYTFVNSVEDYKGAIAKELKRMDSKSRQAWGKFTDTMEHYGRMAEDVSRFAAYVTSRKHGRSIDRSVNDAKEISVNFNRKGSGAKTAGKNGKWYINPLLFLSQGARGAYVFWNAGVQGLANFVRLARNHKAAFAKMAGSFFGLGFAMPMLMAAFGGDDDDYYNLPEYVRRQNICFKVPGTEEFVTIPLPIELRAIYGLGELLASATLGKENLTGRIVTRKAMEQVSQIFPIDVIGEGGFSALVPSYAKPVTESLTNKSWTGLPIYRKNDSNKYMPEWTKAYKSTSPSLVKLSETLNRWTGGNKYRQGAVDFNPAIVEHLVSGYLGGVGTTLGQLQRGVEALWDEDMRTMRNVPVANRFTRETDERAEEKRIDGIYYDNKEKFDKIAQEESGFKKEMKENYRDPMVYAKWRKMYNDLAGTDEYKAYRRFKAMDKSLKKWQDEYNRTGSDETRKRIYEMKDEMNRMTR